MVSASGLRGSFPLNNESIDKEVAKSGAGTYALGNLNGEKFQTLYVGRSDRDLRQKLKTHIGQVTRFKFEQYSDPKQAFDKECELYHFLKPRANTAHPKPPATQTWKCPECGSTG